MDLEARIWTWRLEFGPQDWDMREGGTKKKEEEEKKKEKIPICVKA